MYKNRPYVDVVLCIVALLLLIVIAQVVVPLPQATFFAAVVPSFFPLSFVRVHAPAEPPKVRIAVPLPTEVIVVLSDENVDVILSRYGLLPLTIVLDAVTAFELQAIII